MKSFKSKVKLLAAAVAVAAAAPAGATIIGGGIVGSPTNELFLSVWSDSLKTTYTRDLGVAYSSFLTTAVSVPDGSTNGGTVNWSSSTGGDTPVNSAGSVNTAGYTLTFGTDGTLTSALLGASDTVWSVGVLGATNNILTTLDSASVSSVTGETNGALKSAYGNSTVYVVAANTLGTNAPGGFTNGSDTATPSDGNAYLPTVIGTNWSANLSLINDTGAIGTALSFARLALGTGTNGSPIAVTNYAGVWNLDANGNLSYSVPLAVPEPGTWAMLVAGLMMVGGIARRRMSV